MFAYEYSYGAFQGPHKHAKICIYMHLSYTQTLAETQQKRHV